MPCKSPSKYLSLKYLNALAESDFCAKDKGIDYEPSEVIALIHLKQRKKAENHLRMTLKAYEGYEQARQLKERLKHCSACKNELPFSEFHIDKSKKNFGRRSHCKGCRKIPF